MGFSLENLLLESKKKDVNDKQEICLQHHPFDDEWKFKFDIIYKN